MSSLTLGKSFITLANLGQSVLAFVFDYNETHVKNPRWPPHARFHNGQTMSLGVILAAYSMYLMFRSKASLQDTRNDVLQAAIVASMYFVAGWSAILYPGTDWTDPEFGTDQPQKTVFTVMLVLAWVGYGVEIGALTGGSKGVGKKN